jgi:Cu-Zn family superoxide dismutase
MSPRFLPALVLASLAALPGCKSHDHHGHDHGGTGHTVANAPAVTRAVAVLTRSGNATTQPAYAKLKGTVTFTQGDGFVEVVAVVEGLPPNSVHGFHVHEKPDLSSPDLMSTGPHWDPDAHNRHGAPGLPHVHDGDFGNLTSNADGVARLTLRTKAFTLAQVLGKPVIVHGKEDDLTSQPAGNAGPRILGGLIEPAK